MSRIGEHAGDLAALGARRGGGSRRVIIATAASSSDQSGAAKTMFERQVVADAARCQDPARRRSDSSMSRSVKMPGPGASGSSTTAAPTWRSAIRRAAARSVCPGPTVSTTRAHAVTNLHSDLLTDDFATFDSI